MTLESGARLRLDGICFSYGGTPVVRDLSLDVQPGEMIALLGASGCGKTTILKLIAGLLAPDRGVIAVDEQSVNAAPVDKRRTAMVFQKPLLFPYLSVEENVGFSLKMQRLGREETRRRVEEALAMVRLEGYGTRRPGQLSGGQEQRVALARALVSSPRILLLDEPFASLDENLRVEIRSLVRSIQRKLRITSVFVTHDRMEAAAMSNRIALLYQGGIEQCGTLREFYEAPATVEAARFFGWQIVQGGVMGLAGSVWGAFRPEAAKLNDPSAEAAVPATVEGSIDLGNHVRTVARLASGEAVEVEHAAPAWEPGAAVSLSIAPGKLREFPQATP